MASSCRPFFSWARRLLPRRWRAFPVLLLRGLVEPRAFAELRALVELRVARRASRCARRGGRLLARRSYSDRELLPANPGLLELLISLVRHALGQVHGRTPIEDLDPADVHRV